jgi:integrase
MSAGLRFASPLAQYFDDFVAFKRASGAAYGDDAQPHILRRFDRYLTEHWSGDAHLSASVVQAYFDSLGHLPRNSRRNPVGVAWQALTYAQRHGGPVEAIPPRPDLGGGPRRNRDRYVFTLDEIARLRAACRELGPRHSLRPHTYQTLIALLYVTGIRISEALGLAVSDVDVEGCSLFIRAGKFRKERRLPIRLSTAEALQQYLRSPKRVCIEAWRPFFVCRLGRQLRYGAVRPTFRRILTVAAKGGWTC